MKQNAFLRQSEAKQSEDYAGYDCTQLSKTVTLFEVKTYLPTSNHYLMDLQTLNKLSADVAVTSQEIYIPKFLMFWSQVTFMSLLIRQFFFAELTRIRNLVFDVLESQMKNLSERIYTQISTSLGIYKGVSFFYNSHTILMLSWDWIYLMLFEILNGVKQFGPAQCFERTQVANERGTNGVTSWLKEKLIKFKG